MAFPLYLAMTAGELQSTQSPPTQLCYMAIHFSAYSTGLSNIPQRLPAKSVLILNDHMRIRGHDPQVVASQLTEAALQLDAEAILLDWERPACKETQEIAAAILHSVPCPVAMPPDYVKCENCPVFLPPPPINTRLETYIAPWAHREIWLEIGLDVQKIAVTKDGSSSHYLPAWNAPEQGHTDEALHCHHCTEVSPQQITFTLWRTEEDLQKLLAQARALGIQRAIGLYQQLADFI